MSGSDSSYVGAMSGKWVFSAIVQWHHNHTLSALCFWQAVHHWNKICCIQTYLSDHRRTRLTSFLLLPSKMSLPPQVCWDNCMWSVPLFSSIKTKAVSFMLFSGADCVLNLTCLDWSLPGSSYRCSLMMAGLKGGGFGRWAKMGHRRVAATTSHCAEVRTVCLLMVLV